MNHTSIDIDKIDFGNIYKNDKYKNKNIQPHNFSLEADQTSKSQISL